MENKHLQECERQALQTLMLKAIKMCVDDNLTREEMTGVYKFLVYLSEGRS